METLAQWVTTKYNIRLTTVYSLLQCPKKFLGFLKNNKDNKITFLKPENNTFIQ